MLLNAHDSKNSTPTAKSYQVPLVSSGWGWETTLKKWPAAEIRIYAKQAEKYLQALESSAFLQCTVIWVYCNSRQLWQSSESVIISFQHENIVPITWECSSPGLATKTFTRHWEGCGKAASGLLLLRNKFVSFLECLSEESYRNLPLAPTDCYWHFSGSLFLSVWFGSH